MQHQHLGLVRKLEHGEARYAIRCSEEQHPAIKKALGLNAKRAWLLEGAPIDLTMAEIQELTVKALTWPAAEFEPESVRFRKGKATWIIRADSEPGLRAFPVQCGDEIYSLTVKPKEKAKEYEHEKKRVEHSAQSWEDALSARFTAAPEQGKSPERPVEGCEQKAPKRSRSQTPVPKSSTTPVTVVTAPMEELKADMALLKEQMAVLMQKLSGEIPNAGVKRTLDGGGEASAVPMQP